MALGKPNGAEAVQFMGLHAASGTPGFLAHTLTARLAGLEVKGRPMRVVGVCAAGLARFGGRAGGVGCQSRSLGGARLHGVADVDGKPHLGDAQHEMNEEAGDEGELGDGRAPLSHRPTVASSESASTSRR